MRENEKQSAATQRYDALNSIDLTCVIEFETPALEATEIDLLQLTFLSVVHRAELL